MARIRITCFISGYLILRTLVLTSLNPASEYCPFGMRLLVEVVPTCERSFMRRFRDDELFCDAVPVFGRLAVMLKRDDVVGIRNAQTVANDVWISIVPGNFQPHRWY